MSVSAFQEFRSEITNFVGMGCDVTEYKDGSGIRNRINLALPGHGVEIIQREEAVIYNMKELRGRSFHSSTINVSNVPSMEQGEEISRDLAALLSFAQQSRILPFAWQLGDTAHRVFGGGGFVGAWRPPFSVGDAITLKKFIEMCWPAYQQHKDSRSLFALFALLAHSDFPDTPLEIELSQVMVCLENLKAYWALSDGIAHGITEQIDGFYKSRRKCSFKSLVEMMLSDVGMALPANWNEIVGLRNAIIHRGFIRVTDAVAVRLFGTLPENDMYRAMLRIEHSVHDLIREYILRLLGYRGSYHSYSNPNAVAYI